MARIRTIKPEFFTSEDIVGMTPLARLFYVSLWCESDRDGRLEWKPGTFKMRYLPGDSCDVAELAKELIEKGLIVLYTADGKQYAEIPTFTEHQVINNRESESNIPARTDANTIRVAVDRVPSGVNLTPATRETILARDKECRRCGSRADLTVDHIFPQSIGGTHNLKNLRCLCRSCNSGRPVAGEALIADLESDGLTLDDMNDYCFDASPRVKVTRPRVKAEGKEGREGKGKEGKEHAAFSAGFLSFWGTWPKGDRKQDKNACWGKWELHGLEDLTDTILADVIAKKQSEKWLAGFWEMPMTYINNRRWEDGLDDAEASDWPDTRKGVEKRAVELGLSTWDELEQYQIYKARVIAAHQQGAH